MLTYVEQGTVFINEYGGIKENAYDSMLSVFDQFTTELKVLKSKPLFNKFEKRIRKLIKDVSDIGYGFGDMVSDEAEELIDFFDSKYCKLN